MNILQIQVLISYVSLSYVMRRYKHLMYEIRKIMIDKHFLATNYILIAVSTLEVPISKT